MKRFALILVMSLSLWSTVWAHGVKDPVCRMEVDTHATAYEGEFQGQTYYFCSSACQKRFETTPQQYVKTLADLSKSPKAYEVQIKTSKEPLAGKPASMTFTVVSGTEKAPVKTFEVVHEQLMHLVMVSEDLNWFTHEHPTPKPDGTFDFSGTFPNGGRYYLYTDFTPADGDNQLIQSILDVSGKRKQKVDLVSDSSFERAVDGYRVNLAVDPTPLQVEKAATLTYSIRDSKGNPITDMEPYLGAMGHLFAVHQGGAEVVHTHATSKTSSEEHDHSTHTSAQVKERTGPDFSFKLTLPKEGLYKIWAQFSRQGKTLTVPFVLEAKPLWEKASAKTGCNCGCKDCQKKHAEN